MPPLKTDIVEILQAVEDRLVSLKVVADRSQVVWSGRNEGLPHIKGQLDVVLKPRVEQEIQPRADGGGRYDMVMVQIFDVTVRTSYAGSEASSDKAWLKLQIPFQDKVLDALAWRMIADQNGNEYLTCPLKYLRTSEPAKEVAQAAKNLWGGSVLSFEAHFVPKVDQTQS